VSKIEKLLRAAQNNPENVRFTELCQLAEAYGFLFSRQRGSHSIYKRPGQMSVMTFQNDRGMAKAYQVKQLLAAIDEISSNN
jgi:HicA-like toxin of HicAB toxin-antitoxin system